MRTSQLLALCLVAISGLGLACADTVAAKQKAGCKTALDLIASQNPNLPMHPAFQEIFNSPSLKGTLYVPTAQAWEALFEQIRQRQGNPEAPAMVARYGQIMLYHLAQDINVPIAQPTPGAPRFAHDTASQLQCSVGPDLPNNKVVVNKTPNAIYLEHGPPGKATIVSQPLKYCGGEAFLVDTVLMPCADVSAVMGEIANVPSPCKNNVEGVLHRNGLTYFNALLLATGMNRPIFAAVRNFTMFAPTDAAIQAAYDSGSFNYAEMFATNKAELAGVLAYHAVPQTSYSAPSRATANMQTMLSQGHGTASCSKPTLGWRADGFVYGGSGAGKLAGTYDRGCAAVILQSDTLLQPCCKGMKQLIDGFGWRGPYTDRALTMLRSKIEAGSSERSTFVLPSEEAWEALEKEAKAANRTLNESTMQALVAYLYAAVEVADVIDTAVPVKSELALKDKKVQQAVCPKGTNATLVFAYDAPPAAAQPDDNSAEAPLGAATTLAALPAAVTAQGPPVQQAGAVGLPPASRLMMTAPSAAHFSGGALPVGHVAYGRRLSQTKLPTGAPGGDSSVFSLGRKHDGATIITAPVMIVDGAAEDLASTKGIPVTSISYACNGAVYHVNTVPLPCNFLGRKAADVVQEAPQPAPKTEAVMTIADGGLANTTAIPGAVAASDAPSAKSAAGAAAPLVLGSAAGAVLLAALLL